VSLLALLSHAAPAAAAPTVWSGYTYEFVREDFEVPTPVDEITPKVHLTRGEIQGLYNAFVDDSWNGPGPAGTRWATGVNNPDETVAAANWESLVFTNWTAAYGGSGSLVSNVYEYPAVVHLVEEDIYLDLQFTGWTARNGGGFSYFRAEPPLVPEPSVVKMLFIGIVYLSSRATRKLRGTR
jgi:hypothetical protein